MSVSLKRAYAVAFMFRTIEMMYNKVGDALKRANLNSHPTDWLIFMCPGRREAPGPHLDLLDPATDAMAKVSLK